MNKRMIFTTHYYDNEQTWKEWAADLSEDGEETDPYELFLSDLETLMNDELTNLDVELSGKIVAIADIGLWNGRRNGYKVLGTNMTDLMTSFSCDDFRLFYDGYNVKGEYSHHDGTNYVTFREFKPYVNEERFLNLLLDGKVNLSTLNRYTKSLKNEVKKIYGF